MKPVLLSRHPQTPSLPMTLPVRFLRTGRVLRITYRIPGDTSAIMLPPKSQPRFRDNLWQRTCFEVFIMPGEGPEYLELNFSPSLEWAAYHFDGYRDGMRPAPVAPAKTVSTPWKNRFELSVAVEISEWKDLPWRLNLTAVIEEVNGRKSYWALAHPDGPPDFHDPSCFVARLPE